MAFKKAPPPEVAPASPEQLLLQLPRRKIPGVLLHQGQMMQRYAAEAQNASDVALQLPTGSGKTLVGLLIGEWRCRKNAERVVFLCPTRQLVNQVVAQAEGQYGLSVHGFTGPKVSYDPTAKAGYQTAKRIAVTTYSALFNSYPFFDSPDIIIADDAHASESYIASMWSVRIDRRNPEHGSLHTALSEGLLKTVLDATNYARLTGQLDESLADVSWVEKVPTPAFAAIANEFAAIVDERVGGVDELRYPWQLIRDHLDACHVYLTPAEILARPLIPPTWTHRPFTQARQRIFMSATLGEGGDLERLTGRKSILRLPVPEGWDRQGIGRRFFIFPEMSLDGDACTELRQELMKMVARSVVLVPNDRAKAEIASDASTNVGLTVFDAVSIEESKNAFINASNAVGVFANRYDGIDFPGDECRQSQIERLETLLLSLGTAHHTRYTKHEKEILDGLAATDAKKFEHAQRLLGEILGFRAGKHEADASPDPWWIAGAYCIVFEDHSNATTDTLGATKARQAAGHPNWMKANRALTQLPDNAQIVSVLISPVTKAEAGAMPQLGDVAFWRLEDFRHWARDAVSVVRELRRTLGDDCDLAWRAEAQATFKQKDFDAPTLFRALAKAKAFKALKPE
jgi:hypothetical protein